VLGRKRSPRIPAVREVKAGDLRRHQPGEVLRCVVLSPGPREWAAVDIDTGAVLRARPGRYPATRSAGDDARRERTRLDATSILDVYEVALGEDAEPPDPARPEAVSLAREPERVGTLRPRQARRLLASLAGRAATRPLLGGIGPSVAYIDIDEAAPSISVLAPERCPNLIVGRDTLSCTFTIGGAGERLPLSVDHGALRRQLATDTVLERAGLMALLGFEPRYLVAALAPPERGHARKIIVALLPRP
jgi:hypothetical protein